MENEILPDRVIRRVPASSDFRCRSTENRIHLHRHVGHQAALIEDHEFADLSTRLAYHRLAESLPSSAPSSPPCRSQERLLSEEQQAATMQRTDEVTADQLEISDAGSTTSPRKNCCYSDVLGEIWLPLLWIHVTMLLILVILALLVTKYRVQSQKSLFPEPTGWKYHKRKDWILLNVPASEYSDNLLIRS